MALGLILRMRQLTRRNHILEFEGKTMDTQFEERDRIFPRVSLREAIRKDIQSTPGKAVAAAAVIGLGGGQQINNYTCETKRGYLVERDGGSRYFTGGASMSLDQFELLVDHTGGFHTAHALAEAAGGVFIPGVAQVGDEELVAVLMRTIDRVTALGLEIRSAIEDGKVTDNEWRKLRSVRTDLALEATNMMGVAERLRA